MLPTSHLPAEPVPSRARPVLPSPLFADGPIGLRDQGVAADHQAGRRTKPDKGAPKGQTGTPRQRETAQGVVHRPGLAPFQERLGAGSRPQKRRAGHRKQVRAEHIDAACRAPWRRETKSRGAKMNHVPGCSGGQPISQFHQRCAVDESDIVLGNQAKRRASIQKSAQRHVVTVQTPLLGPADCAPETGWCSGRQIPPVNRINYNTPKTRLFKRRHGHGPALGGGRQGNEKALYHRSMHIGIEAESSQDQSVRSDD